MLREVRTWREKKSTLASCAMVGMPLWFGANEAPIITPNTASCTPRNAHAIPNGRNQNTTVR